MKKKGTVILLGFGFLLLFSPLLNARSIYLFSGEKNSETVYGRITDERGRPLVARAELWYRHLGQVKEEGGVPTPESEGFSRNLFHSSVSDEKGWYQVTGFPGEFILRVTKGPEWEFKEIPLDIKIIPRGGGAGERELDGRRIDITLQRLYNLADLGWYAGDPHQHTIHSDGLNTPREVYSSALAGGLSWAFATDHNTLNQNEIWMEYTGKNFLALPGFELTTKAFSEDIARRKGYGHQNVLGINKLINPTDADNPVIWNRYRYNSAKDVQRAIDQTHEAGGLYQLNHPLFGFDWPNGSISTWGEIKNWDGLEVWNGDAPPHTPDYALYTNPKLLFNLNTMSTQIWFEFLNAGNRVAGWASSDNHDTTGLTYGKYAPVGHRNVTGSGTTYVKMNRLNWKNLKNGLKEARVFLTSGSFGPLLLVTANGRKDPGDTVQPVTSYGDTSKKGKVSLSIQLLSNRPLKGYANGVRIILNGKVIKELATEEGTREMKVMTEIPVSTEQDSWLLVQAFGAYPAMAMTNPFFIDGNGDGKWGNEDWTFPEGAKEWGNPWPKTPPITVPDGPAKPEFNLPPALVTHENPIQLDQYLNPDGSLRK
ncbi:MAG: CehA/McbA family metallohydrolase [Deltaproteobacteria bacterium]|nr:CehA/McbA family metallohydrolase [Deltaproteobacteria bacterium]